MGSPLNVRAQARTRTHTHTGKLSRRGPLSRTSKTRQQPPHLAPHKHTHTPACSAIRVTPQAALHSHYCKHADVSIMAPQSGFSDPHAGCLRAPPRCFGISGQLAAPCFSACAKRFRTFCHDLTLIEAVFCAPCHMFVSGGFWGNDAGPVFTFLSREASRLNRLPGERAALR